MYVEVLEEDVRGCFVHVFENSFLFLKTQITLNTCLVLIFYVFHVFKTLVFIEHRNNVVCVIKNCVL